MAATMVVRYHGTANPQLVDDPARPAAPEPVPIENVVSPAARVKPQVITMSPGRTPDVFHGQFTPDSVGLWTFRVDGWGDPIATGAGSATTSATFPPTTARYVRMDGETPADPLRPAATRGQVVTLDTQHAGTIEGIARASFARTSSSAGGRSAAASLRFSRSTHFARRSSVAGFST